MVERTQLHSVVPLVHVHSVPRSIEFYAKLGFAVSNTHTPEGGAEPVWAWLQAGGAHLMIVEAFRTELLANGVQAGVVEYPFWAPRGEFRVDDPDGYVLMVTHT